MGWSGLSLRYKIMFALTAIPLAGLSLFLAVAVSVFEKDKIAYVFDSSLSASQTRAARVKSETQALLSLSQSAVAGYRADLKTLDDYGKEVFKSQGKFLGFQIYAFDAATSTYQRTVDLHKDGVAGLPEGLDSAQSLLLGANARAVVVDRNDKSANSLVLAARFGRSDDPKHLITIALFDSVELSEAFSSFGAYSSFLVQGEGSLVFGAPSFRGADERWTTSQIWARLASARKAQEGIAEITSPGKRAYLASFVKVGSSDLAVVSLADKRSALAAVDVLLRKSFLFFIATLSLTVLISVFAARALTSALGGLLLATQRIAGGDFATRVKAEGGDEIGRLGASFNVMAEEVSRLLKDTAEKARMEAELATARTVQETLFPPSNASLGPVEVSGYYEPASECGGDWWHYCENGDFVYLWIGDATGHGAPAALLTSAARAVASVLEMGAARPPAECIAVLNRAIWDASKGKMMMTFFLAAIDKRTGLMAYANASHEAPLLLHRSEGPAARGDYLALNQVNNPRLGESAAFDFQETSVQLRPGDRLVFYTDGVVDVKSPDDKAWGERKFLKALSSSLHGQAGTEQPLRGLVAELQGFRRSQALDDDVTLVLVEYKGAA